MDKDVMPERVKQGLNRHERLNAREVSRLFSESMVAKGRYFVVRATRNDLGFSRIAPIASRKSGKAAKRNRIKRRIRAAFREQKMILPQGYDLAIIARYGVIDAEYAELVRSLRDVTEKACNLCNEGTGKNCDADN